MADRKARVRISALGRAQVRRELRGIVQDALRSNRDVETSRRRARDIEDRESRRQAIMARRRLDQYRRDNQRMTREAEALAERRARADARAEARSRREHQKTVAAYKRAGIRVGAVAAGATLGAIHGAFGVVGRAQRLGGVGTVDERLDIAAQFRKQLILTANEAKVGADERMGIEKHLLEVSKATNIPLLELSQALESAQVNFDAFREFADIIGDLAVVSAGKNVPLQDLVNVLGAAKTGLGISGKEDQNRFLDMMIATAERGSIEPGLFAREIGPFLAQYAEQTDRKGLGAASELMALVQGLGKFQPGQASEIKTQLEALLFAFREKDTQQALRRAGVEIFDTDANGQKVVKPMNEIAQQMAHSERFQREVRTIGKGGIFGRKEAARAATFITTAVREDPRAFSRLMENPQGAGLQAAQQGLQALKGEEFFKLQSMGIEAQVKTVEDLDRLIGAMRPAAERLTELQTEFPVLTEAIKSLEGTLLGAAAGFGLGGMGGGLGGGVGKTGGLGKATGGVLGAFGAGAFGVGIGNFINDTTKELFGTSWSEFLGNTASDALHGTGNVERTSRRGIDAPLKLDDATVDKLSKGIGQAIHRVMRMTR